MSKVIKNDNVVFFDVDGNLIDWDVVDESKAISIDNNGMSEKVVPLEKTINRLKQHKLAGCYIVVHSQNGASWAEVVCRELGLQDYVDLYMTKAKIYYDDLPFSAWTLIVNANKEESNG